ncbi:MAG TPA: MBL fold metallo-hydrolase [Candidatus Dormibacteraeota bacterium]|nr:MBL fold metallo-hydrolase [Candidatus Dormibacteraeota bacterium]
MIRQMIAEGSGCCSYFVGSGKEFILVDPLIDVERFTKSDQLGDSKIVGVIDTHVHADHLSGSREIQRLTGCPVYMNETSPVKFPFVPLAEREYHLAGLKVRVIHTPGHAPEHVSLLVEGRTVLTGDTLLIGDVGRVDLGRGDASKLYDSLFGKLLALEDQVEVMPGHVGKAHFVSSGTSSTIGLERQTNPALQAKTRDEFIKYMTEGWPPKPDHYELYVKVNSGFLELGKAKFS